MIIINTEAVGKCYSVPDSHREKHDTFLGAVAIGARHAWRQLFAKEPADQHDNFWALRDVSFSIKEGDRVGLIGRNGSGKSTLLKIISRVTEPTKGRITLRGRVRSLLEVGTGFHPELTGRENIYLNGAILGMSYSDVNRKFDEIVDFAEIGHFLDMPVKRYSSGMYWRLDQTSTSARRKQPGARASSGRRGFWKGSRSSMHMREVWWGYQQGETHGTVFVNSGVLPVSL